MIFENAVIVTKSSLINIGENRIYFNNFGSLPAKNLEGELFEQS